MSKTKTRKTPKPGKLSDENKASFERLNASGGVGTLALVSVVRKSDNASVGLICSKDDDGFHPLAVMIEGDPADQFDTHWGESYSEEDAISNLSASDIENGTQGVGEDDAESLDALLAMLSGGPVEDDDSDDDDDDDN